MRAIWVTPSLPHPRGTGGCAHEYELIRAMVERGHELDVVSADLEDPLGPEAVVAAGARFTRVPWRLREHPDTRLGVARAMLRATPSLVLSLRRERIAALTAALREAHERSRPDLVHITIGELAPLIGAARAPTAMFLFDSLSREIEGRLRVERLPRRRLQQRVELARTTRYERRWYRQATGVAAVSSVDAAHFERLLGRPVEVIENPVAEEFFVAPERPRSRDLVSFVGTINHQPNEDALEWFLDDIWPRVVARHPGARLRVAGRGDPSGVKTRHYRSRVAAAGGELFADVDDIRPHYWEAACVVTPIRVGAGMRNKVIHAMACGAPLVTTPRALEGVPSAAADSCLVAAEAERFADAVVDVLERPDEARARAARAAAAVRALATPSVADRFEAWWARVAAGR